MKDRSVIIGAGTQGQVYASYLIEAGIHIIGFIDDNPQLIGEKVNGLPVIGCYLDLYTNSFKEDIQSVYCPIGDNHIRVEYLSAMQQEGYNIPSFIHPSVSIGPDVILGQAIYMLVGNIVMPHTTLGNYIMINQASTIAHHVKIEDGAFMSSGVNIGACIHVQEKAYIGMGVTVMTGVQSLGRNCLLGAGSVIIKDVPENAVMVGNPGRILKYQKNDNNVQCKP
ncbi:NeuD/PglB/VioB family sugar acetyltransferase [Galbibacter sp.]|jgi:sugar O-acyltransferase (sialic acid O-acetyltransferase NeuD family)|uniref:NeuD/PglB/VioB family sugar acetyltransferase n=1 Tax=Galbibacter sp. TaxID=2918471 RepID=UPI003A912904